VKSPKAPVHLIYVPGLGDGYDPWRRLAFKRWNRSDIDVTFVPMRWRDAGETFDQKLMRLRKAIDSRPGYHTVLIGESAGGAVTVVAAERFSQQIDGVITICGKNARADHVSPSVYARQPAFKTAIQRADTVIAAMSPVDGRAFYLLNAQYDSVIKPADSYIPGAHRRTLWLFGHLLAIAMVLVFERRLITRLARQLR
jgi:pimeloyl-ACP methyl ester carboxylesterase